jgi:hypothetical protein
VGAVSGGSARHADQQGFHEKKKFSNKRKVKNHTRNASSG